MKENELEKNIRKESFTEFYNTLVNKYKNNVAFIYKPDGHTKQSRYIEKSFADFHRDRLILKKFFKENNYTNSKIAITGRNSYVWEVSVGAILSTDNIAVPLDKELQIEELKQSLTRSGVEVLLYDKRYEDVVLEATKEISKLQVFTFDSIQKLFDDNEASLEELAKFDSIEKNNKEDLKMLLFTSGTTSLSKMVMLSRDNLLTNIYDISDKVDLYNTDTYISLLPLHHVFGLVGSLFILHYGVRTAFSDGLRYVAQNLEEYQVSLFIGVPLLVEGMYNKVVESAKKSGKWKLLKILIKVSNFLRKLGIDIRRKLFKTVINGLGGHMRFIISAAASLDPDVLKFFNNIGIFTIQGYGLTETSPVLTAENKNKNLPGSVGVVMEHTEIKIDKDSLYNFYIDSLGFKEDDPALQEVLKGNEGEILTKGRNITKGYYKDPEKTKEAFTEDGWFKTGDIGYMKGEFLFITGRIKDMIVLPNGKKAFPEEMEFLFHEIEGVVEPFIFGSDKNLGFGAGGETKIYVAIYYDKEFFKGRDKSDIQTYFSEEVKKINRTLPKYKYIRGVVLYEEEFVKTTTKKIKRHIEKNKIEENYTI